MNKGLEGMTLMKDLQDMYYFRWFIRYLNWEKKRIFFERLTNSNGQKSSWLYKRRCCSKRKRKVSHKRRVRDRRDIKKKIPGLWINFSFFSILKPNFGSYPIDFFEFIARHVSLSSRTFKSGKRQNLSWLNGSNYGITGSAQRPASPAPAESHVFVMLTESLHVTFRDRLGISVRYLNLTTSSAILATSILLLPVIVNADFTGNDIVRVFLGGETRRVSRVFTLRSKLYSCITDSFTLKQLRTDVMLLGACSDTYSAFY